MTKDKPTVTELLNILNKPALLKWANKIGLQGIALDDYYKKSKKAGTSLHKQIEEYLLHGVAFEDNAVQQRFELFQSDKVFKEVESVIETEYFRGRLDAKIIYKDNLYLCDFKSNDVIYLEQKLQLTAYRMSDRNCKIAIIKIPEFTFKEVIIEDYKPYEDLIFSLTQIYHLLKIAK
jgi:hypothetical protein